MSAWKKLAEANFQVLMKRADGKFLVELVDANLIPTVRVTPIGKQASISFPLEKLGAFFADETLKVYAEDSGDEITPTELHDLAVEAYFEKQAEGDDGRHICKGDKCKNWNVPGYDYCVTCKPSDSKS